MNSLEIHNTVSLIKPPRSLEEVIPKILDGIRITPAEGLALFEKAGLGLLGMLANHVCRQKNGNTVYFIRNFHIEPTNICINKCRFCSYSHHFSPEKWEMTEDEILEAVRKQDKNIREVHITGAVHPDRDVFYYGELLRKIRKVRPGLHIKAYSAVEIDYMIRKSKMTIRQGLLYLKECGLQSIPGGGAEIFDETIRKHICGMKTTTAAWIQIHETAHKLGIPSNATILYGHVETLAHRIDHLERLRQLQDRSGGFNAFIPLKFHRQNNEMSAISESPVTDDMRMIALSRIYLDNFPHIKAYWPAIGKKMAQVSLSFGVDDLDGTINDSTRIYSLAGAEEQSPAMTVSEMKQMISETGKIPVERDSNYNVIPENV